MADNALDLARARASSQSGGYSSAEGYHDSDGNVVVTAEEIQRNPMTARKKLLNVSVYKPTSQYSVDAASALKNLNTNIQSQVSLSTQRQKVKDLKKTVTKLATQRATVSPFVRDAQLAAARGTSSLKYGYVDSTGQQIATSKQIQNAIQNKNLDTLRKQVQSRQLKFDKPPMSQKPIIERPTYVYKELTNKPLSEEPLRYFQGRFIQTKQATPVSRPKPIDVPSIDEPARDFQGRVIQTEPGQSSVPPMITVKNAPDTRTLAQKYFEDKSGVNEDIKYEPVGIKPGDLGYDNQGTITQQEAVYLREQNVPDVEKFTEFTEKLGNVGNLEVKEKIGMYGKGLNFMLKAQDLESNPIYYDLLPAYTKEGKTFYGENKLGLTPAVKEMQEFREDTAEQLLRENTAVRRDSAGYVDVQDYIPKIENAYTGDYKIGEGGQKAGFLSQLFTGKTYDTSISEDDMTRGEAINKYLEDRKALPLSSVYSEDLKQSLEAKKRDDGWLADSGQWIDRTFGDKKAVEDATAMSSRLYAIKQEDIAKQAEDARQSLIDRRTALEQRQEKYVKTQDKVAKTVDDYNKEVQPLIESRDKFLTTGATGGMNEFGETLVSEVAYNNIVNIDNELAEINAEYADDLNYVDTTSGWLQTEAEALTTDMEQFKTDNTEYTQKYGDAFDALKTEYKEVTTDLKTYDPIEAGKLKLDEYTAEGNFGEYYLGKAGKFGLGVADIGRDIVGVAYGTGEELVEDYETYGAKDMLLADSGLGWTIKDEKVKQGLTGNKYGLTGVAPTFARGLSKNIYDWDDPANVRRTWSEATDWDTVMGVADIGLIATGAGAFGTGAKSVVQKSAVQAAKGAGKVVLGVEAGKLATSGGLASYDYMQSYKGDDTPNYAWDYGFIQPGKMEKYMRAGYRNERATVSDMGGGLREWATSNVPGGSLMFGDADAFAAGVEYQAIQDGMSSEEAKKLAKVLKAQRIGTEASEVGAILYANIGSEAVGRLEFKELGKVAKPFGQSFAAVAPAGAFEGAAVYTAQALGNYEDVDPQGIITAGTGGAITAGTISGIINKGMSGSLFGGKNPTAVSASKFAGKATQRGGFIYDLYEYAGDRLADVFYPSTKGLNVPMNVITFTSPMTFAGASTLASASGKAKTVSSVKGFDSALDLAYTRTNTVSDVSQQPLAYTSTFTTGDTASNVNLQAGLIDNPIVDIESKVYNYAQVQPQSVAQVQAQPEPQSFVESTTKSDTKSSSSSNTNTQSQTETPVDVQPQPQTQAAAQALAQTTVLSGTLPYGRVTLPQGYKGWGAGAGYLDSRLITNRIADYAGEWKRRVLQTPAFDAPKRQLQKPTGYDNAQTAVDRLFGENIASGRKFKSVFGSPIQQRNAQLNRALDSKKRQQMIMKRVSQETGKQPTNKVKSSSSNILLKLLGKQK